MSSTYKKERLLLPRSSEIFEVVVDFPEEPSIFLIYLCNQNSWITFYIIAEITLFQNIWKYTVIYLKKNMFATFLNYCVKILMNAKARESKC